jgi:hypothetical protein
MLEDWREVETSLRECLDILASAQCALAAVTVEIIGTPPQINARQEQSVLYVITKGGAVSNFKCLVTAFVPEHGDPAPPGLMICKAPEQIDSGQD